MSDGLIGASTGQAPAFTRAQAAARLGLAPHQIDALVDVAAYPFSPLPWHGGGMGLVTITRLGRRRTYRPATVTALRQASAIVLQDGDAWITPHAWRVIGDLIGHYDARLLPSARGVQTHAA